MALIGGDSFGLSSTHKTRGRQIGEQSSIRGQRISNGFAASDDKWVYKSWRNRSSSLFQCFVIPRFVHVVPGWRLCFDSVAIYVTHEHFEVTFPKCSSLFAPSYFHIFLWYTCTVPPCNVLSLYMHSITRLLPSLCDSSSSQLRERVGSVASLELLDISHSTGRLMCVKGLQIWLTSAQCKETPCSTVVQHVSNICHMHPRNFEDVFGAKDDFSFCAKQV